MYSRLPSRTPSCIFLFMQMIFIINRGHCQLGNLNYFLEVEVIHSANGISFSQSNYINDIRVQKFERMQSSQNSNEMPPKYLISMMVQNTT